MPETPTGHRRSALRSARALVLIGSALAISTCGREPGPGAVPLTLDGIVLLGEPVAGATVRVEGSDGRALAPDARTNDDGRFTIDVLGSSSGYRVVASGGGTDTLGAVTGSLAARLDTESARRFVAIDPITTLADAYVRGNRRASNAAALEAVGAFLGIPKEVGAQSLVARDAFGTRSPHFNPVRFAAEAQAAGGLDPFVASLAGEMQAKRTRSFADPPGPLRGISTIGWSTAGFVLNRALDRSGLLDKIGLGASTETRDRLDDLKRSIDDLKDSLRQIKDQIAATTEAVRFEVQELREFGAFTSRNAVMYGANGHVTTFETVKSDYMDFLTGSATTIAKQSLIGEDIKNKILAVNGGPSFRDRVSDIHAQIVPSEPVGGLSEGVLTLVAKVARANGKPFSVVENYFIGLLSWETFAMGTYLDAKRYVKAPAEDIENLKKEFAARTRLQRRMFLEAADAYALYGGPLSTTDANIALSPMRRADVVVNTLEGSTGWFTMAAVGVTDPVLEALATFEAPYVSTGQSSVKWPLDATIGPAGATYYNTNAAYPLTAGGGATTGCYYYVGPDYAQRKEFDRDFYAVAGHSCTARLLRYRASRALPPFMIPFRNIEDKSGVGLKPDGQFVQEDIDMVSGTTMTKERNELSGISLLSHADAYGSPTSEFDIRPISASDPSRVVIVIPPNELTIEERYLTPVCASDGTARFGISNHIVSTAAALRPEVVFTRYANMGVECSGNDCPARDVAFGFTCGAAPERFMTPLADGRLGAGTTKYYLRATKDRPGEARTRLSYTRIEASRVETRHLYLNVPTSVGFFGALVGGGSVGKSRDLGVNSAGGTRMQTGFGGWHPNVNGSGRISVETQSEKRIKVRVLGDRALSLSASARGRVTGHLLRDGHECFMKSPTLFGTFSADSKPFATLMSEMPSGCVGRGERREHDVDQTFEGTGTIATKSTGSTFDLVGNVKAHLYAMGGNGFMQLNANAQLKIEKLELSITNPGDR